MIHAVLAVTLFAGRPGLEPLYRSARSYDRASFRFAPPTEDRLRSTRALVTELVRALRPGAPPAALVAAARAAGWTLEEAQDPAGQLWVLREPDGQREGAGFFAFRARGAPACVQAPHTFFDEGTGEIALALFARLHGGALFVNTVHRYAPSGAGEHAADGA